MRGGSFSPSLLDEKIVRLPNKTLKKVADVSTSDVNLLDFSQIQALYDNEIWAMTHCQASAESVHATMDEVFACLKSYFKLASNVYRGNPELYSVMLLTCCSFLVILDKQACLMNRMILDHGLDIDTTIMNHLLLPLQDQLSQLRIVENHLKTRFKGQDPVMLMGDPTNPNSLDVRYARSNSTMQNTRETILEKVKWAKMVKRDEVEREYRRYQDLTKQAGRRQCEFVQVQRRSYYGNWYTDEVHSRSCYKCRLNKEANQISVSRYRNPFPPNIEGQYAVVFELHCPNEVRVLRSAILFLKNEVLTYWIFERVNGQRAVWSNHSDLRSHRSSSYPVSLSEQVTLMSSTDFNYRPDPMHPQNSPSGEQFIIENQNDLGLGFVKANSNTIIPIEGKHLSVDYENNRSFLQELQKKCTMEAKGVYKCLQWTIDSNLHSDNEVICRQSDCPAEISLKEFRVFGSTRAGNRTQIRNLVAAFKSNALSWHFEGVLSLVCQVLWETGKQLSESESKSRDAKDQSNAYCRVDDPRGNSARLQHRELLDEDFVRDILKVLEVQLDSIQENWDKNLSLLCLVTFGCRLLEFSESKDVISTFLFRCRKIGLDWVRKVKNKIESLKVRGVDESPLKIKLVQISLTVASTFFVSNVNVQLVLNCADHATTWMIVQNNVSDNVVMNNKTSLFIKNLVQKCWLTGLRIENALKSILEANSETIQQLACYQYQHLALSGEEVGADWASVPEASPWMKTDLNHGEHMCVNILTGTFLVNGDPVKRLPTDIRSHPFYQRIFGSANLTVAPGDYPGSFVTTNEIDGACYQFLMMNSILLITKRIASKRLYYLPENLLKNHLPYELCQFSHWLEDNEENSKYIEFRCRNVFSSNSPPTYRIEEKQQHAWELIDAHDASLMIGMHSDIFDKMLRLKLDRIEKRDHIHLFLLPENKTLTIKLPRHRISFSISGNFSQISPLEFPGFKLADSDYLGTLIGLRSCIVLDSVGSGTRKKLIIPHSDIIESFRFKHVRIEVNQESFHNPSYFAYNVDENFKQLSPPSSDEANLYLAMLHVKTSYPLPDPFTKLTGFEMSMQILNKGRSHSCTPLDPRSHQILKTLQGCCRERKFRVTRGVTKGEIEVYPRIPPYSMCTLESLKLQCVNLQIHSQKLKYMLPNLERTKENSSDPGKETVSILLAEQAMQKLRDKVYPLNIKNSKLKVAKADSIVHNTKIMFKEEAVIEEVRNIASIQYLRNSESRYVEEYSLSAWANSLNYMHGFRTSSFMDHRDLSIWKALTVKKECMLDLYDLARKGDEKRDLLYTLTSFLAYEKLLDFKYMVSFLVISEHFRNFQTLDPPDYPLYQDLPKTNIVESEVRDIVKRFFKETNALIDDYLSKKFTYAQRQLETFKENFDEERRKAEIYLNEKKAEELKRAVSLAMKAWPDIKFQLQGYYEFLDKDAATEKLSILFYNRYTNKMLFEFLKKVESAIEKILEDNKNKETLIKIPNFVAEFDQKVNFSKRIDLKQKLKFETGPANYEDLIRPFVQLHDVKNLDVEITDVESSENLDEDIVELVGGFEAEDAVSQDFKKRLEESWKTFNDKKNTSKLIMPGRIQLEENLKSAIEKISEVENAMMDILLPKENEFVNLALHRSGLVFRDSPLELVPQLFRRKLVENEYDWKDLLGALVIRWTEKQRLERCLQHLESGKTVYLEREWKNVGHTNWVPRYFVEWLILEAEGNFIIRPEQVEIALQMFEPPSEKNAVMQLNMGEGKSSVIVPMLVASISRKEGFCPQVVVLSSLYPTNSQSLSSKLGNILGMRLLRLPFCRDLELTCDQINHLSEYLKEHKKQRGFLVSTPEQMMSMQLKALEVYIKDNGDQTKSYHGLSILYEEIVRNVLDESDDILSVKRQLIYTMGSQIGLDGNNQRWIVLQSILRTLKKYAGSIFDKCGSEHVMISQERNETKHQFNVFRLLDKDSESFLKISHLILDDFLKGSTEADLKPLTADQKAHVKDYIMADKLEINQTENLGVILGDSDVPHVLFLLRGFFGLKILQHCLTLRHRVNYGTGRHRNMAVPFRAKDVAADKTDFGHPDVALALTQLTYYYQGIPEKGFEEIMWKLTYMEISVATAIYAEWVAFCHPDYLPDELKSFSSVNVSDKIQLRTLYDLFHKHVLVVDFWLVHLVYPQEAKQFPKKLSTTGWDLCSDNGNLVTGFSGTNETQLLLPLTIEQCDLASLQGTNALVMHNMLKPENQFYWALKHGATGPEILNFIIEQSDCKIKVILDPGALILMQNAEFIRLWMSKTSDVEIEAGIFFDDKDNMMVRDRKGFVTRFHLSPYAEKLSSCIIYLDDVHTRGTDLQFPSGTKAAVTLGKGLAKDKLAQACMRMRLLGCGHSLAFFASYEVDLEIQSLSSCLADGISEVGKVISWVFGNSKKQVKDGLAHWANQGTDQLRKMCAYDRHNSNEVDSSSLQRYGLDVVQKEVTELRKLYGNYREKSTLSKLISDRTAKFLTPDHEYSETCKAFRKSLVAKCEELIPGKEVFADLFDEEQERELEHEEEEEQQVVRPGQYYFFYPIV